MTSSPRVLAFSGSLRKESFNQKLVTIAARGAKEAGAEVTVVTLRDFPMPIFSEDDEAATGMPDTAKRFRELLKSHDALLIASPEYNSSVSAALKNTIDWGSRQLPGETPLQCFKGKTASLVCASPGKLGGLRGLEHIRSILCNIMVNVLGNHYALSAAHEAFAPDGSLKDAKAQEMALGVGRGLAEAAGKLRA